ncbi:YybH family protein [Undibacterium sp.]|uniref:YybH family protein n=1 Tax=Undibacterium sp. TaxID=1914977 RepID=UPI003750829E
MSPSSKSLISALFLSLSVASTASLANTKNLPIVKPDCASPNARAAIEATLKGIDQAWINRDPLAIAALYALDANLSLQPDNAKANGRANIEKLFAGIFSQIPKNVSHTMVLHGVSSVGEFCAVDTSAVLDMDKGDGSRKTLQKFSGFWLLRPATQGMEIVAVRAVGMS